MPSVIVLSVFILGAAFVIVTLSVIVQNVVMLTVVAPKNTLSDYSPLPPWSVF